LRDYLLSVSVLMEWVMWRCLGAIWPEACDEDDLSSGQLFREGER